MRALYSRRRLLTVKLIEINAIMATIEEMKKDNDENVLLPLGYGVYANDIIKGKSKMPVRILPNYLI